MKMNSPTNSKSVSDARVAEVKKSRTVSNSRRWLAKAPVEEGRAFICRFSTCSKMRAASSTSARRPTVSIRAPRRLRSRKSNSSAIAIPATSTHSVSTAWLGSTRS